MNGDDKSNVDVSNLTNAVADACVEQLGGILVGEMAGLPAPAANAEALQAEANEALQQIQDIVDKSEK
jgi:hypothetical protein